MIRRLLTSLALCFAFLGLAGTAAHAAGEPEPPDWCFEQTGPNGELPSCEYDGTQWSVSYDEGPLGMPGPGIPAGFVVFGVMTVLVGIGLTIWRVSLAREMAQESGMDPDRAATLTLLSDDGLDATYLASSLRGSTTESQPTGTVRSANERLRELQQLRDEGLISAEEYETRRTAIVDSL